MANALYAKGREKFGNADIDWLVDTIKVALVTSGYTPNLATHEFLSDLGANVLGTAQTLASKTNSGGTLDAADVAYGFTSGTATYIAIYRDSGVAGTSALIGLIDTASGLPAVSNGAGYTVTIQWDASGIVTI